MSRFMHEGTGLAGGIACVTEEVLATCEEQPEVFTLECGSSLLLSSWNQLPPRGLQPYKQRFNGRNRSDLEEPSSNTPPLFNILAVVSRSCGMATGGAARLCRLLRGVGVSANSAGRATGQGNHRAIHGIDREEPEVVRAILRHTEATRDHMTPEIQLFLLTPNCTLYHEPSRSVLDRGEVARNVFSEPFWAIYWPGGQALARFLLDEGENLFSSARKGMNVLDVGSGCGAAAIAAKLAGAEKVVANDIDKVACTAVSMNAALNHVDLEVSRENLLHGSLGEPTDIILIGDMLYDEEIAGSLVPWIERAREDGSRIYLGDPGRHCLSRDLKRRLRLLKEYSLPENIRKENYGYDRCNVWEFLGRRIKGDMV